MNSFLQDKGFVISVLGVVVLTALVFVGKVDADVLLAWLGGAAGPTVGRLRRDRIKAPPPLPREEPRP